MDDAMLRKNLVELLEGGNAYAPIDKVLAGIKAQNRHVRPAGAPHSVWEELQHMRIAQEDILRYSLDENWQSPPWPDAAGKPSKAEWNAATKGFFKDLKELKSIVRGRKIDLTATIPHGEGRTYLRQVLLAADHNAYHAGQIVVIRRLLKDWPV